MEYLCTDVIYDINEINKDNIYKTNLTLTFSSTKRNIFLWTYKQVWGITIVENKIDIHNTKHTFIELIYIYMYSESNIRFKDTLYIYFWKP